MINSFHSQFIKSKNRGAATLISAVILLTLSALIIIIAGKSQVTNEKMAANMNRHAQAFQAADAGLEFGISYLTTNQQTILANPVGGYIPAYSDSNTTNVVLANNSSYSIVYSNPIANNYNLIRITSTGTSDDGTATKTITQLVQFGSLLANAPTISLTGRGNVNVNSSSQIINLENNNTIKVGGEVDFNGTGHTTLSSGTSSTASSTKSDVQEHNNALQSMSSSDFFTNIFGVTSSAISSKVGYYYNNNTNTNYSATLNGKTGTSIWINQTGGSATINGTTVIGSAANPVLLIINGPVRFSGNVTIYGFVYVSGSTDTDFTGSIVINGALAASDQATIAGNATINYSSSVITNLQNQSGMRYYAKVAGSWKDF